MRRIKYHYSDCWVVIISQREIFLQANIGNPDIGYKKIGREYDIPEGYQDVEFDDDYIRIKYPDRKMYQFKLEGGNCIVGDVWEGNELIDEIAMYDLYDDWDEPVPTRG